MARDGSESWVPGGRSKGPVDSFLAMASAHGISALVRVILWLSRHGVETFRSTPAAMSRKEFHP
jgi:hypothetical protein